MSYEAKTDAELSLELEARGLKTSGDRDELLARLELDDAEREIEGQVEAEPEAEVEPEAEPEPEVEAEPEVEPEVEAEPEVEPEPDLGARYLERVTAPLSGIHGPLPGTHQPENQDPSVAFRLLPDGRKVPMR